MERKLFVWLLVASLMVGCLGQEKPTPASSPAPINRPPTADFSYSWTGGDKNQPWTCSKVTFKAEVSDPDGDYFYLLWLDNDTRIPQALGGTEFETKLWPDGIHTIKLVATDIKGAKTVVEKQINVEYEVPEPVPVKTKNGVSISVLYLTNAGIDPQTHPESYRPMYIYTPLLGFYNISNPVVVDWHIKWALEHGINTLWIAVAPHGDPPEKAGKGSIMISYKDGFLKSKYKDRIKYNVFLDIREYNSFDKWYIPTDSIEKDFEILSKYHFNQPNYKKIDGRPIVYLFGTHTYLCNNCENKKEKEEILKSHIKSMRKTAKGYGYDLFLIGDFTEDIIIEDFDAFTNYGLEGARNPDKYDWKTDETGTDILIAPYDDMVDAAIKWEKTYFDLAKNNNRVYIPNAIAGFDNEKALMGTTYYNDIKTGKGWMIKRTNPTPEKFNEYIKGVESLIDPKLKILLTNFNEFWEGNGIEPTHEFGFAYLDIIRDNFAIKPPGGWPPNVVPTRNCGCAEYKGWNTEIGMPGTSENAKVEENEFLRQFLDEMKRSFLFIVSSNSHYTPLH